MKKFFKSKIVNCLGSLLIIAIFCAIITKPLVHHAQSTINHNGTELNDYCQQKKFNKFLYKAKYNSKNDTEIVYVKTNTIKRFNQNKHSKYAKEFKKDMRNITVNEPYKISNNKITVEVL